MVALKKSGHAEEIIKLAKKIPVFGICGGYQILGNKIIDEEFQESKYGSVEGLGLLDIETTFGDIEKIITQSKGQVVGNGIFENLKGEDIVGYELHEGVLH